MSIMMKVCIPCNKMALKTMQFLGLIDIHGILDNLQPSSFDSSSSSSEPSQSSETVIVDRTTTPSMACSPSSNTDPTVSGKKSLQKKSSLKNEVMGNRAGCRGRKMHEIYTRDMRVCLSSW